jgi:hypothetical protein
MIEMVYKHQLLMMDRGDRRNFKVNNRTIEIYRFKYLKEIFAITGTNFTGNAEEIIKYLEGRI